MNKHLIYREQTYGQVCSSPGYGTLMEHTEYDSQEFYHFSLTTFGGIEFPCFPIETMQSQQDQVTILAGLEEEKIGKHDKSMVLSARL